jgi:hypothetical protein
VFLQRLSVISKLPKNLFVDQPFFLSTYRTPHSPFLHASTLEKLAFKASANKLPHVVFVDNLKGDHAFHQQRLLKILTLNKGIKINLRTLNIKDVSKAEFDFARNDLKNLALELKKLNLDIMHNNCEKPDHIGLYQLCTIPLKDLEGAVNKVQGTNVVLTPGNVSDYKELILDTLNKFYNDPGGYKTLISSLDQDNQNLASMYGVIQEINTLIKNGSRIKVVAGHAFQRPLQKVFKNPGVKTYYYHYIATNKDPCGVIEREKEGIVNSGTYEFNLFELSNAESVSMLNAKGIPHVITAQDSLIDKYQLGTCNLTPVRDKQGKVTGYSFTDKKTVQLKQEEFRVSSNLEQYVGLQAKDLLALDKEHVKVKILKEKEFKGKELSKEELDFLGSVKHKIFKVNQFFSDDEIKRSKMYLRGEFVDFSGKLFFNQNESGEIFYPKLDCESTGKPSLCTMFGTCMAVTIDIAKDIIKSAKKGLAH